MRDFDHSLPMLLNLALDAIMPPYRELFAQYDLTEQQWRVLRVLWSSKKVTSVELARRTLVAAPSLVRILDRLQEKQLVSRVRSSTDRRVVYVVASAKGRAVEKRVTPQVEAIQKKIRATVTEAEWDALEKTLSKVRNGMRVEAVEEAVNV